MSCLFCDRATKKRSISRKGAIPIGGYGKLPFCRRQCLWRQLKNEIGLPGWQADKGKTDSRESRGHHPAPPSRLSVFCFFRKVFRFARWFQARKNSKYRLIIFRIRHEVNQRYRNQLTATGHNSAFWLYMSVKYEEFEL